MSIKKKILLLFAGTFVFTLVSFLITWEYQHHELSSVEKNRLAEVQKSFGETIALPTKELKTFVYENSYWDEMVSFVESEDVTWAEETLTGSLEGQQYDYIAIFDSKKNTVFYHQHHEEAEWIKNLFPRSTLKMKEPVFSHYFLLNDGKLIEIYSAPIQPSKDTKRTSIPHGYFLVGKIWDSAFLEQFAKKMDITIKILPAEGAVAEEYDFLYPVKSYDDTVIAYLGVTLSSVMLDTLSHIYTMQFYMLLLFGLVTIGFASFVIYQIVVKPLKIISEMIVAKDPSMLDGYQLKQDEFSEIAHSLETLFTYQKNLEEEKAHIESELHQRVALDETLDTTPKQDPVLDVQELYEIIGSSKLADKFLRKFLDELIGKYLLLPSQIANHEADASIHIHTLKGTSANVRAYRLHYACRAIDEKFKSGNHILSSEIDALKEAINEVKERLQFLGYTQTEAGGLSIQELHTLYDEIKETLQSLNTVLPEKQRILIANLQEVVDPELLEDWDWAMCESEYEKALTLMLSWKIFKVKVRTA